MKKQSSRIVFSPLHLIIGGLISMLFLGEPNRCAAAPPTSNAMIGISIWVSKPFIQQYLASEYHGQNVSIDEDQSFGFENTQLFLKDNRAQIKAHFWYERSLTGRLEGEVTASFNLRHIPAKKRVMLTDAEIDEVTFKESPGFSIR